MGQSRPNPAAASGDDDPTAAFLEALAVRRNGTVGAIVGVTVSLLLYGWFVVRPATTTFPRSLYLPLIAVVAFGVAVLVAAGLTALTAWRRVRGVTET